jgi:hypothetical protein
MLDVANELLRVAKIISGNEIQDEFLSQRNLVERVVEGTFGKATLMKQDTYRDEDAYFKFTSSDRMIIVKIFDLNKRTNKLSVWASIVGKNT